MARPPQRILLVDDDELELELMADRLRSLGFETHTVSDGGAALELLQTQSFPVVITDWQMPRMDGIRLTENLRGQGDNDTYIIMLDSFTTRVGCAAFIPGEEARPSQQVTANIEALLREAEAGARVAPLPATSQRPATQRQSEAG